MFTDAPLLFAALSAAVGIACLVLHRRLPGGLGGSLFAFGITVALALLAYHADWRVGDRSLQMCLLGAVITPIWAVVGALLDHGRRVIHAQSEESPAGATGEFSDAARSAQHTAESILAWAVLTGAATVGCMVVLLMEATVPRVTDAMPIVAPASPMIAYAFAGLAAAVMIWRLRGAAPQQPAVMLALAGLFVWWTSLLIPAAALSDDLPEYARFPFQPGWWTWDFQLQIGLTILLVSAAIIQDRAYRRRRRLAWPDNLDDLLLPYSRWSAYIQIEAFLAAIVLVLGVFHIVRSGGAGILMPIVSGVSAVSAGSACLYMTYRRWSSNTSGLGLSLLSLGVVTFACAISTWFIDSSERASYAQRMPVLFNATLFGIAVMIWLWRWLADVWDQQLLDGAAWTTTGRMIPHARRTAFYLAAIGILVAYQMALWPERALTSDRDDGSLRVLFGMAAILLLSAQCAIAARQRGWVGWAAFAVIFAVGASAFLFVRLPASSVRGWLVQHEPIALGVLAVPILLLAESLPRTAWRAFSGPLWFLALLFFPMKALIGLLPGATLSAAWIRPTALAILAIVYFMAGGREHRRAFLVLGAVLLLASCGYTYRLYWS